MENNHKNSVFLIDYMGSDKSSLSLATINRLKNNKAGTKTTNKYKLIW